MLGGDQHLGSVVHHGIDEHRDGGISFCVPSVSNTIFKRRWMPTSPPLTEQGPAGKCLGDYDDAYGNHVSVLAVANPIGDNGRADGYGILRFTKKDRTIILENWPRDIDPTAKGARQYPGWPVTIKQRDNDGRKPIGHLPEVSIDGVENAVLQVYEPTRRLAELERDYLSLLDGFGASPKTLVRFLSEDPVFFAKVISIIFRSKKEQDSDAESTEQQQQAANHWYRLLMNWNRIPGTQPDGSVDEEQLLQWLESARSLCRDSGHLEVADSKIGEMLATWPQSENESVMWPCEEICDAIEEANSDDLDHGFQIGIRNSRGVTTRSPLDGGDLERKEAAKYRRWAEHCDIDWPRTAASLRSVADSYDFDAQREDARAAERAQDRR